MFDWLTRRLRKPKEDPLFARFRSAKFRCPDCGGGLLMGPEGGCAVNVTCEACGHEYNVGIAGSEPFSIERLRI
jgi:uncharacterized protein (DUF983 family)